MILGSIEAGGTKFVCAVGNENYEVIDKAIFPTIDPATTIGNCIAFFKKYPEMQAMSVASFGPIDIDKHSAKYGYITDTPKIKWSNCDFIGMLKRGLGQNLPIYFTTDVNGSVYGEY
ncbi:MAG TPA: fructokinase/branched chain amino acid--2-keto-4-methylthiobutyrate aminotransferase, partial [Lactobacillus sp.]|nr:fructokinase/branched chain amino acid--2-keto-4-methylthiobutyrate aminotransferase [Lactobacillus sp.]